MPGDYPATGRIVDRMRIELIFPVATPAELLRSLRPTRTARQRVERAIAKAGSRRTTGWPDLRIRIVDPGRDPRKVFLNIPFDTTCEPIFIGLVAALVHLGIRLTTVLQLGGGGVAAGTELAQNLRLPVRSQAERLKQRAVASRADDLERALGVRDVLEVARSQVGDFRHLLARGVLEDDVVVPVLGVDEGARRRGDRLEDEEVLAAVMDEAVVRPQLLELREDPYLAHRFDTRAGEGARC